MDNKVGTGRWRTIGLVYAAWLLAALVAGVLGSARLLATAERQPFGPWRDALVAGATTVDALGARLGLDGPRRTLDRAIGRATPAGALATATPALGGAPSVDVANVADVVDDMMAIPAAPSAGAVFLPASDRAASNEPRAGEAVVRVAGTAAAGTPGIRPDGQSAGPRRITPDGQRAGPRRITPDGPLRVHVAGDSFAEPLGYQLATYATRDHLLTIGMDFRISTGMVRRDYFDWQARMVETLAAATPPEVVVFFLGANEDQNMQVDGAVLVMGSDAWQAEYGRRAAALMDLFEAPGIAMVWVGMPDMRDPDMVAAMAAMTRAVEAAASDRPWVTWLDTRPIFRGADGGFAAFLPSATGELVRMRGEDGIHLTRPGTNRVAERVYALLTRAWDLRTPTSTPTIAPTATPTPTNTPTATSPPTRSAAPAAAVSPGPGVLIDP